MALTRSPPFFLQIHTTYSQTTCNVFLRACFCIGFAGVLYYTYVFFNFKPFDMKKKLQRELCDNNELTLSLRWLLYHIDWERVLNRFGISHDKWPANEPLPIEDLPPELSSLMHRWTILLDILDRHHRNKSHLYCCTPDHHLSDMHSALISEMSDAERDIIAELAPTQMLEYSV